MQVELLEARRHLIIKRQVSHASPGNPLNYSREKLREGSSGIVDGNFALGDASS